MVENLKNIQGCQSFPKIIFVYWKSKKLEEEWSISFSKGVKC